MVYCCFFEWGVRYLANGLCGFDSYALRAEILFMKMVLPDGSTDVLIARAI